MHFGKAVLEYGAGQFERDAVGASSVRNLAQVHGFYAAERKRIPDADVVGAFGKFLALVDAYLLVAFKEQPCREGRHLRGESVGAVARVKGDKCCWLFGDGCSVAVYSRRVRCACDGIDSGACRVRGTCGHGAGIGRRIGRRVQHVVAQRVRDALEFFLGNPQDGKLVLDVSPELYGIVGDTEKLGVLLCPRKEFHVDGDALLLGEGECRKGNC